MVMTTSNPWNGKAEQLHCTNHFDIFIVLQFQILVAAYGHQNVYVSSRTVTLHLSEFRSDMLYYFCAGFVIVIDKDELDNMSDEELMWGGEYIVVSVHFEVSNVRICSINHFDIFIVLQV